MRPGRKGLACSGLKLGDGGRPVREFFLSPRSTIPVSWLILAAVALALLAPYAGCHLLFSPPSDPGTQGDEAESETGAEKPASGTKLNDLESLLGTR